MLTSVLMTSCYEDYIKSNTFAGVYFTYQEDVRSVIVGEDSDFKVGAVLVGQLDNDSRRVVNFTIDDKLVTPDVLDNLKNSAIDYNKNAVNNVNELEPMPKDWYSLSNESEMIIEKGKFSGGVTVKIDVDKMTANPETKNAKYAIPFMIERADADSIMEGKDVSVIAVKYECKLYGNYYHYGIWKKFNLDDNMMIGEPQILEFNIPMPDNCINELSTYAPYKVITSMAANSADYRMILTLNEDNTVGVEVPEGVDYEIEAIGECKYNNPNLLQDRKISLKYKVIDRKNNFYIVADDVLQFRNRIRDGVNEWRDSNPENYSK